MFRKAAALALCTLLAWTIPYPAANAAPVPKPQNATTGYDPSKLSMAVVKAASANLTNVVLKNRAGTLTTSDVDRAIATTQVLFAHWEEIGFIAAEDTRMSARLQAGNTYTPTERDGGVILERWKSFGADPAALPSADQIQARLTISDASWNLARDAFQANGGILELRERLLGTLTKLRSSAVAQRSKPKLSPAKLAIPSPVPPIMSCATLRAIADVFWVACAAGCIPECCVVALFYTIAADACDAGA